MNEEILILRELAKEYREICEKPSNIKKIQRWRDHNDLIGDDVMYLTDPDSDGVMLEMVPSESLKCQDANYRQIEYMLRSSIYHATNYIDHKVFENTLQLPLVGEYTGYRYGDNNQTSAWGIEFPKYEIGSGAYHVSNFLDTDEKIETLLNHEVDYIIDDVKMQQLGDKLNSAIGDITNIQFITPRCCYSQGLLNELVHLRGLGEIMFDLYDEPDMLKSMIHHMSDSKIALMKRVEASKRLYSDNCSNIIGTGGLGFTNEPIKADSDMKLWDMWGFADAQEFSEVSNEMFVEFALEYQKRGLNYFGKVCYGCCEPVENKIEVLLKELPTLRRVSVSPWSDRVKSAERLGRKAIYSCKINPSAIINGYNYDNEKAKLLELKALSKDIKLEIILKDLRTCGGNDTHIKNYAKLVGEVFDLDL